MIFQLAKLSGYLPWALWRTHQCAMQPCLSFPPFQLTLLPGPSCRNHESQAQVHTWTCPCVQQNARELLYNSCGNEEQMKVKGALLPCLGLALSVGPLQMLLDQCSSRDRCSKGVGLRERICWSPSKEAPSELSNPFSSISSCRATENPDCPGGN